MRWRAERLNKKAIELEEKGWSREAELTYIKAAEADGDWSVPWFNLGLLAKRQRRWSQSLEWNREAIARDVESEGAWWNLGIAATALSDWPEARRAWTGFGLDVPDGIGPIEMNMGSTPIRISSDAHPEVVWSRRIDPARAIILSVPLPESSRRYNDLVLHDGAPNGYRLLNGTQVPVFDEIELLEASNFSTYQVTCRVAEPADLAELVRLADESKLAAEDWSENIQVLCKSCSEGTPQKHHLHEASPWTPERRVGIAASSDSDIDRLLAIWRKSRPVTEVLEVSVVLSASGD